MLKDDMLFVGVGQCGGNIVQELEKLNFNCFYINTSLEDLDTINTDQDNKYHIPRSKGMAKDREYAISVLSSNDNLQIVTNKVYERYSNCKIVYYVASSGGGTGGTMSGIMAEDYAEAFPEKVVNVVAVLPSSNEDMLVQANAIKSLEQINNSYKNGFISNVHLLDNDKKDNKMQINHEFAHLMNSLVSFDNISKAGNLDAEEMERILTCQGYISAIQFKEDNFDVGLNNAYEKSIYADWLKSSSIQGYILNKNQNNDTNKQLINEVFGIPTTCYSTIWDNENNIIFSLCNKFNESILSKLKRTYKEIADKRARLEREAEQQSKAEADVAIDVDFSEINLRPNKRSQRTRPQQTSDNSTSQSTTRRTSRRREGVSNTLDRLRNLQ